jgi:hypothetical protein
MGPVSSNGLWRVLTGSDGFRQALADPVKLWSALVGFGRLWRALMGPGRP